MKKKRTLMVLLLAILSGSVAAFSVVRYLQDRPAPLMASTPAETRPVVVAARQVALGATLTEEDLQVIQWPATALPQGIATSTSEVVGRSVISDLHINEPVLAAKLADTGLHGLIPLIPSGMRALSVKVDEVVGVAGFVTPQTRVDVILIMQPPGQRETVSKVILQNIRALAANQQITETENGQPRARPDWRVPDDRRHGARDAGAGREAVPGGHAGTHSDGPQELSRPGSGGDAR